MTLEEQFEQWAKPPSQAQQDKSTRAVAQIGQAIKADSKLGPMMTAGTVRVFPQGSYANNLNVRDDSDVDVCVLCDRTFIWDGPDDVTLATLGASPASYDYATFKDDVGVALVNYFGKAAVRRGNKAYDIHEATFGVEADAAPCFEYRRYQRYGLALTYPSGTALRPDNEYRWIHNFPVQQRERGDDKNGSTNWRYKKAVRVLKKVRYSMIDDRVWDENRACSFLLESAIWNQLNDAFSGSLLVPMIRTLLWRIHDGTGAAGSADSWTESNGIKSLFYEGQNWSKQDLRDFCDVAWSYLGFHND